MDFDSIPWLGADVDYNGRPLLIRLRQFAKEFPVSKYPERLNITWSMSEPDENGLPTDQEFERVAAFENRLVDAVEPDEQSILIGVLTCNGEKEFIFQTADPSEFLKRLTEMPQETERYPITIERYDDPEWDYFKDLSAQAGEYLVEIWFRVEKDHDGFPQSTDWEQLLGRPQPERDDYFEIESVPFYLRIVSRGDIVQANISHNPAISDEEIFEFSKVVKRGGHNTYRLLLKSKRPDDPESTQDELMEKGLTVEIKDDDFLAIDVPPSVDQKAIDEYLLREKEAGRWSMQDGYLHGVATRPGEQKDWSN